MKPKLFQSYLFVGAKDATRIQTTKLASNLAVSINPSSPDFTVISPKRSAISIDQIRNLKKYIFEKPFSAPYKLIVIEEANSLTIPAQNALLKILEEPPAHAIIVLETLSKEALAQTITSRTVTSRIVPKKSTPEKSTLLAKNSSLYDLLNMASNIDKPAAWLDIQIAALHDTLLDNIFKNKLYPCLKISFLIRQCAQAKLMIEASVNPKFVLFNLIFRLNSKP